jgi:F-type H+-transporting ATPase subunit b
MTIDWWTLGLQLINALVLVWILGKFLFRPVSDMIKARQDEADAALADAAKARDAASVALREATDATARIGAERGEMLKAAARDADAEKQTRSEEQAHV